MKYTVILTFSFANTWLRKSRQERQQFEQESVHPIFEKYSQWVNSRFFDAEAFEVKFTDFAIFEVSDLKKYYFMIEELRDSPLLTEGFAIFHDIHVGIENGYEIFEQECITQENI